jgi:hypothetical protein
MEINPNHSKDNKWQELTNSILLIHNSYPNANIVLDSEKTFYELEYYAKPLSKKLIKLGLKDDINIFKINLNKSESSNFLYVTQFENTNKIETFFTNIEKIGNINIGEDYYIYHLK